MTGHQMLHVCFVRGNNVMFTFFEVTIDLQKLKNIDVKSFQRTQHPPHGPSHRDFSLPHSTLRHPPNMESWSSHTPC